MQFLKIGPKKSRKVILFCQFLQEINLSKSVNEIWANEALAVSTSMIKYPSDELFAFKLLRVTIYNEFSGPISVNPDAAFLFANTSALWLKMGTESMQGVEKMLNLFDSPKLDFFTLEFTTSLHGSVLNQLDCKVRSRVNALHLTQNSTDRSNIDDLFHYNPKQEVWWPKLTELKIDNFLKCKAPILTPVLFKLCPKLCKLELMLDGLSELFEDEFGNASNLVKLKLFVRNGSQLKAKCFQSLVNLRVLKLNSWYKESFIHLYDITNRLLNLERLEISEIFLSTSLEKFPAELLKLRQLKLGFAHVQCIAPTAFDHLLQLEKLEITIGCLNRSCRICPHKQEFETGVAALRHFTCSSVAKVRFNTKEPSLIEEITLRCDGSGALIETTLDQQPMFNLKRLSLDELRSGFPFHIMINLEFLNLLEFDYSSFSDSKDDLGPFDSLPNLKSLNIHFLRMLELKKQQRFESGQFFSSLTSLTSLVIENCQSGLITIRRDLFKHLPNLEHLELRNLAINQIESDAFFNLPNLKHLDLSNDSLNQFPFACLTNDLANLEHLSLNSNRIKSLDGLFNSNDFTNKQSQLRVLDLANNKISVPLPQEGFLSFPSLVKLNLNNNIIDVIEPGAFEGLVNLRYLGLARNKFQTFDFGSYFFFDGSTSGRGLMPFNLMLLELCSECLMIIEAPTVSMAKCCFRNQVIVGVNDCHLKFRHGLDMLVKKGVIQLGQ
jgi:hypothetical protein